jgi:hypothetical protein
MYECVGLPVEIFSLENFRPPAGLHLILTAERIERLIKMRMGFYGEAPSLVFALSVSGRSIRFPKQAQSLRL